MHAVVVTVEIDPARYDEARQMLDAQVVPQAKESPGFVRGTWARSVDGTRGHSFLIYNSEKNAQAAVSMATSQAPPAGAPVKMVSADVLEVLADV
jgi:hypothetical protein